jgi:tRNA threonylcarbamoyladenosine biosynthesis protein TsaB
VRILAVDTALGACSVALVDDGRVLAHHWELMDRGHAEALAPMVERTVAESPVALGNLDRLAVTVGPGTFTGQRVGLSFMRGLRLAIRRPLTGITTLAAMAEGAKAETGLPVAVGLHDARRDEVYIEIEKVLAPSVLPLDEAVAVLRRLDGEHPIALAGTAAIRVCDALSDRFVLSRVRQPDALWVAKLAAGASPTEEVPRPLYLRAPDARPPGKMP